MPIYFVEMIGLQLQGISPQNHEELHRVDYFKLNFEKGLCVNDQ
jgi:hypothetical protein